MCTFAIVIEDAGPNFCAYMSDLPGCTSTGYTIEEVTANIHETIELHTELIKQQGESVPQPTSQAVLVEVDL